MKPTDPESVQLLLEKHRAEMSPAPPGRPLVSLLTHQRDRERRIAERRARKAAKNAAFRKNRDQHIPCPTGKPCILRREQP